LKAGENIAEGEVLVEYSLEHGISAPSITALTAAIQNELQPSPDSSRLDHFFMEIISRVAQH
jgi:hypothetical protein